MNFTMVGWYILVLCIWPYTLSILYIWPGKSLVPHRYINISLSLLFFMSFPHSFYLWMMLMLIRGRDFDPHYLTIGWFLKNLVFSRLSILVLLFHYGLPLKKYAPDWILLGPKVTFVGFINILDLPVLIDQSLPPIPQYFLLTLLPTSSALYR